jgi:hypothetical protein
LQWLGDTNFLVTIENTSEYPCHMGKSVVIAFDINKKISGFGKANLFPENEIPIPAGKRFGYDAYIPSSLYDRSTTFEVFPKLGDKVKVCAKEEIADPEKDIPLEIIKSGGGGSGMHNEWNYGMLLKNHSEKFTISRIDYHVNIYDGQDYLVATSHEKYRQVGISPNESGGLAGRVITHVNGNWKEKYRLEAFFMITDIELYSPYEKPIVEVTEIKRLREWGTIYYRITNNTEYIFRFYAITGILFDAEGNIIGGGYQQENGNRIFSGGVEEGYFGIATTAPYKRAEIYPSMCAQRVNC